MKAPSAPSHRSLERTLRVVAALALGVLDAAGCAGSGIPQCYCTADGARVLSGTAGCTYAQLDAGCVAVYGTAGPLPPPELPG